MNGVFSKLARPAGRAAAASASAAAATTAAQPSAQARAPPQVQPRAPASQVKVVDSAPDGWMLAEMRDGAEVLFQFQPYSEQEVEEAVGQVAALFAPASPPALAGSEGSLTPPGTGRSSSDGTFADLAMEQAEVLGQRHAAARAEESRQINQLLLITNRLLRQPGLQCAVLKGMIEDEVVREVLLREAGDLDGYLQAVGITKHVNLLPPAAGVPRCEIRELPADAPAEDEHGGNDVMAKVAAAVSGWLERAGRSVGGFAAFLGGWLRDRLDDVAFSLAAVTGAAPPPTQPQQHSGAQEVEGEASAAAGQQGRSRRGDRIVGGVMMMVVMVFCVMLIRRPIGLRMATVAAAAAAMHGKAAADGGRVGGR